MSKWRGWGFITPKIKRNNTVGTEDVTEETIRKFWAKEGKEAVNNSALNTGTAMPLFSKRKQIADDCEEWCKIHKVPACPQNIITAALKLNLVHCD